jgi:hypothetical protein
MRAPSDADLLEWWDAGHAQAAHQRGVALLAISDLETPRDMVARLAIGERDARLLRLRELVFGRRAAALADCPACGGLLELEFDTSAIRVNPGREPEQAGTVDVDGWQVRFRLPHSVDLASLIAHEDVGAARMQLLDRCVLMASREAEAVPVRELPARVVDAIAVRMAQADPQADVRLALDCPCCRHQWDAIFDIGSFLWAELDALATRLLREVHELASAYGWREADILAMSAARRQSYLGMVGG